MEVRAKKSLGQHFLTDLGVAQRIVGALEGSPVLEVGPGTGVLTRYLLTRFADVVGSGGSTASLRSAPPSASLPVPPLTGSPPQVGICPRWGLSQSDWGVESSAATLPRVAVVSPAGPAAPASGLKVIEIDRESVAYLEKRYPELGDGLIEGDFLKMDLGSVFPGQFSIIGNFPYNISSQIFFKIIDNRDLVPEVVCMIQKEVAERIAEKPGTKTYGILSVFLQAWYDIEYLFTVGPGAFNPPPKVQSAVIRLTRNSRTELGCDEKLFRSVVKTSFGQRRKTLRNSLKPLLSGKSFAGLRPPQDDICHSERSEESLSSDPIFDLRPERLSVEDFIALTRRLQP